MTEYNWDFEDDEYEENEPQAQTPNLPKELRKVIRDAKKAEKEAREEAAALKALMRTNTVTDVLKARNVPDKVAKLIPTNVEATPDAIGKWLDEYGDVFGTTVPPAGTQTENTNTTPPAVNADLAAMQRMQSSASTGEQLGSYEQQLLDRLNDPDLTEEQFNDLVKADKARQMGR